MTPDCSVCFFNSRNSALGPSLANHKTSPFDLQTPGLRNNVKKLNLNCVSLARNPFGPVMFKLQSKATHSPHHTFTRSTVKKSIHSCQAQDRCLLEGRIGLYLCVSLTFRFSFVLQGSAAIWNRIGWQSAIIKATAHDTTARRVACLCEDGMTR